MEPSFDESMLTAYLDNELTLEERAVVEAELERSPELRKLFLELQGVRALVQQLHRAKPPTSYANAPWHAPSQVVDTVGTSTAEMPTQVFNQPVTPLVTPSSSRVAKRVQWQWIASLAASVMIIVTLATLSWNRYQPSISYVTNAPEAKVALTPAAPSAATSSSPSVSSRYRGDSGSRPGSGEAVVGETRDSDSLAADATKRKDADDSRKSAANRGAEGFGGSGASSLREPGNIPPSPKFQGDVAGTPLAPPPPGMIAGGGPGGVGGLASPPNQLDAESLDRNRKDQTEITANWALGLQTNPTTFGAMVPEAELRSNFFFTQLVQQVSDTQLNTSQLAKTDPGTYEKKMESDSKQTMESSLDLNRFVEVPVEPEQSPHHVFFYQAKETALQSRAALAEAASTEFHRGIAEDKTGRDIDSIRVQEAQSIVAAPQGPQVALGNTLQWYVDAERNRLALNNGLASTNNSVHAFNDTFLSDAPANKPTEGVEVVSKLGEQGDQNADARLKETTSNEHYYSAPAQSEASKLEALRSDAPKDAPKMDPANVERSNVERSNVEPSNVEPSNSQPTEPQGNVTGLAAHDFQSGSKSDDKSKEESENLGQLPMGGGGGGMLGGGIQSEPPPIIEFVIPRKDWNEGATQLRQIGIPLPADAEPPSVIEIAAKPLVVLSDEANNVGEAATLRSLNTSNQSRAMNRNFDKLEQAIPNQGVESRVLFGFTNQLETAKNSTKMGRFEQKQRTRAPSRSQLMPGNALTPPSNSVPLYRNSTDEAFKRSGAPAVPDEEVVRVIISVDE